MECVEIEDSIADAIDGGLGLFFQKNQISVQKFTWDYFTLHRTVIPSSVIPLTVSSYPLYLPRNIIVVTKKGT